MSPDQAIAMLDRQLAAHGQDCILRRIVGAPGSQTSIDVTIRAFVRSPAAAELAGGFKMSDSKVIFSPTQILAAAWPGNNPAGAVHPEIPRTGTGADKVVILGVARNVEMVNPILLADTLVRIEVMVRG